MSSLLNKNYEYHKIKNKFDILGKVRIIKAVVQTINAYEQ